MNYNGLKKYINANVSPESCGTAYPEEGGGSIRLKNTATVIMGWVSLNHHGRGERPKKKKR